MEYKIITKIINFDSIDANTISTLLENFMLSNIPDEIKEGPIEVLKDILYRYEAAPIVKIESKTCNCLECEEVDCEIRDEKI